MKLQLACITLLGMIASPFSQAASCMAPLGNVVPAIFTSVAAPEMFAALAPEQACLTAQQLVDLSPTAAPAAVVNGDYVPKTKFDNTPWRFDMNQNGKRMTAEQFDAWMKAKGIHVATGRPTTTTPDSGSCQPSDAISC